MRPPLSQRRKQSVLTIHQLSGSRERHGNWRSWRSGTSFLSHCLKRRSKFGQSMKSGREVSSGGFVLGELFIQTCELSANLVSIRVGVFDRFGAIRNRLQQQTDLSRSFSKTVDEERQELFGDFQC